MEGKDSTQDNNKHDFTGIEFIIFFSCRFLGADTRTALRTDSATCGVLTGTV
jgi:hypothetical protein